MLDGTFSGGCEKVFRSCWKQSAQGEQKEVKLETLFSLFSIYLTRCAISTFCTTVFEMNNEELLKYDPSVQ
eukprot:scaffold54_cov110-Cylindrotheca_fusiformis.AAC.6